METFKTDLIDAIKIAKGTVTKKDEEFINEVIDYNDGQLLDRVGYRKLTMLARQIVKDGMRVAMERAGLLQDMADYMDCLHYLDELRTKEYLEQDDFEYFVKKTDELQARGYTESLYTTFDQIIEDAGKIADQYENPNRA